MSNEPHRQINLQTSGGRLYAMRVKRHSESDRISSYSTSSDVRFWAGGYVQDALEGMECVNLAVGYRWLSDTRDIGAAVISYREGKDNVVWAYTIDDVSGGEVGSVTYTPIVPELPQVDLSDGMVQSTENEQQ